MRFVFLGTIMLLFLVSGYGQHDEKFIQNHSGIHNVVVKEVIQTPSYTYLNVEENAKLIWLAVPRMEAEIGAAYYYQGGNEMKDFKSSTLNRTFESVWFLGGVVKANPANGNIEASVEKELTTSDSNNQMEMEPIETVEGNITIEELLSNAQKYGGKIVRLHGHVTRFSEAIMGKNWIHIEDGTKFEETADLTITSDAKVANGDVVTLEGKIVLDKDFGFGYFFKVLMEEGKLVE